MITFWTREYPKELPGKSSYLCIFENTFENHCHEFIYFKNLEDMKCIENKFFNCSNLELPC